MSPKIPTETNPKLHWGRMLQKHTIRRSVEYLRKAAERRERATREGTWDILKTELRTKAQSYFGDMPFGANGGELNSRQVSGFERQHYRVENVIFESLPGWEVNGSLYLPVDAEPPYPPVVVPVGHTGKQFEPYQIPAQVFARCGYAALLFDPPGQAGEKRSGNDHFRDGVRCYLTGHTSNRYFVIDALRCIDYLETRGDIDTRNGAGMTGVSGGGVTTLWATMFDERITCIGPSCCISPLIEHPVCDLYAACPETQMYGRFADGLDQIDLVCAAMPVPCLAMAGRDDTVFHIEWTRELADEVRKAYASSGFGDRFDFFEDASGHDYTVEQALEFVRWMNRWLTGERERNVPDLVRSDFEMEPWENLQCNPAPEPNIFTINREIARTLKEGRPSEPKLVEVRKAIRSAMPSTVKAPGCFSAQTSEPFPAWFHDCEEVILCPEDDIEIPGTLLYPNTSKADLTVLYFDERGRWEQLKAQGPLATMAGFSNEAGPHHALFTVDLRGWGETTPTPSPFDIAGWAKDGRPLAYLANAMGESLFEMRVGDALAALGYLLSRPETAETRIIAAGYGSGAVVALHLAALSDSISGVIADSPIRAFQELTESESCKWPPDTFVPEILKHYDLPELVNALEMPALVIDPLDASRNPVSDVADYRAVDSLQISLSPDNPSALKLEWLKAFEAIRL